MISHAEFFRGSINAGSAPLPPTMVEAIKPLRVVETELKGCAREQKKMILRTEMLSYNLLYSFICIVLVIASSGGYCRTEIPASNNPEDFGNEVKEYILQRADSGHGFRQSQQSVTERQIKEDTRDWESILSQMIGNPERYGIGASGVAFDAAIFRDTANTPDVVAAITILINAHIDAAQNRYDRYAEKNQASHPGIVGEMAGMMARALQVGSPEHLLTVLDYFNSEAEHKINLINKFTPLEVALSLRSYGDGRQLEAAKNFSLKLRNAGKNDVADDIERSIERIEKDAARKAPGNGRRSSLGSNPAKADAGEHSAEKENKLSWIVGAIVAGIALIGTFILFRRKG